MQVLLVSPNIESLPDPVFPLGLAFIAAALEAEDIPYRVLDLCFEEDYDAAIRRTLADGDPDVIGLSLRNVDNVSYPHYRSYLPFYQRVVQVFRRHSRGMIVLGGSGFTLLPGPMLEYLGADAGIAGEGEQAFVDLVKALRAGRRVPRGAGRPAIIRDLDCLAAPARGAFENHTYLKRGGMGNIQTKRGCPFKCIYCTYPLIEGHRVRTRDPERVCDEMEALRNAAVDHIFIVDNEFNYPPQHARQICRAIRRRRLNVRWSCYANPGYVDEDLIATMRSAGCTSVEFGTDAATPDMLRRMGKNFTLADVRRASSACRKVAMPFCHSLLLGGPGETMDSVQRTLEAMQDMTPTAVICMIGIRVFPDTALEAIARRQGLIGSATDFLKPVFYLSEAIRESILPLAASFAENNPTWVFPGLHINMDDRLTQKLRRFGLRGPLWEYMQAGARRRRQQAAPAPRRENLSGQDLNKKA
jgi:radical SAM superfamily enzyme YgiQ (UPF0313 family)